MAGEAVIDESLIFELSPEEVQVSDDRPRQRRDLGEIKVLAESIKKFGQIQPIVIDRQGFLVAGGRRLAACLIGGMKVRACYKDTVDPVLLQEIELEENIQRKALTPAEEVQATAKLVELKRARLGTPVPGLGGGFSLTDAADILGKSKASVINDIKLADALKMFPNLAECKTKSDMRKAVKTMERKKESVEALAKYEDIIKREKDLILVNKSAEEYLTGIGEKSIDLFITDPPYGIDIHNNAMSTGGDTGGKITATEVRYDDSEATAKELLQFLCVQSYRITKSTGHAFIFCAPSHFQWLYEKMTAAGWLVAPRPIVWIKRDTGQNNNPDMWFSSAYEFILFARKVESRLVVQGKPDWIQCDPVLPSARIHQAEKPVPLLRELISRVAYPGSYMIDPCMGSGSIIEAGLQSKLLCMGSELDPEIYAMAVNRITEHKLGQKLT